MVTQMRPWKMRLFMAGILLTAVRTQADDAEGIVRIEKKSEADGIVRVSDRQSTTQVFRGQNPEEFPAGPGYGPPPGGSYDPGYAGGEGPIPYGYPEGGYYGPEYGYGGGYCPPGGPCPQGPVCEYCPEFLGGGPLANWMRMNASAYRSRNQVASQMLKYSIYTDLVDKGRWLRCKFGYFVPTGGCGTGVPLAGKYGMVYPVDPNYFDQRDGQVYAAQGYGGPVSVPLAPVVNHTYNYGWGIPSSRLTPILHDPGQVGAEGYMAPVAR